MPPVLIGLLPSGPVVSVGVCALGWSVSEEGFLFRRVDPCAVESCSAFESEFASPFLVRFARYGLVIAGLFIDLRRLVVLGHYVLLPPLDQPWLLLELLLFGLLLPLYYDGSVVLQSVMVNGVVYVQDLIDVVPDYVVLERPNANDSVFD